MKIAYFDCFSGIAGDMALAALLDCGVPLDALTQGLSSLPVEGWEITAEPVLRSGIHAQNVRITLHGVSDEEELAAMQSAAANEEHAHHHGHNHHHHHESAGESQGVIEAEIHSHTDHVHAHTHAHEHGHEHHHHDHDHDHTHAHHHEHDHHHGRSMAEIRELINASAPERKRKSDHIQNLREDRCR